VVSHAMAGFHFDPLLRRHDPKVNGYNYMTLMVVPLRPRQRTTTAVQVLRRPQQEDVPFE
jgi:hypothetical protein